jgi:transcriptional regulator with XRE-family HTH domain
MAPDKAFGQAIRLARKRLNLTQQELADRAGIHFTSLSRLERGDADAKLSTVRAVATQLDMAAWELLHEASLLEKIGSRSRKSPPA